MLGEEAQEGEADEAERRQAAAAQEGALHTPGKGEAPAEQTGGHDAGRVIIFTNRRDSVQSIVDMLRSQEPLITSRSAADHCCYSDFSLSGHLM